MSRLLLVRHGMTATAGKRLTGRRAGVHLIPDGVRQAEDLVERLRGTRIDAIASSPLERCRETAAPLARDRGIRVEAVRDLVEIDFGGWVGRSLPSLYRTKAWQRVRLTPSLFRFPDGESFAEAQQRVIGGLMDLAAAHPKGTVAVFSHADTIKLALAYFAGAPLDAFQRFIIEPASISIVQIGASGAPGVLRVNDTGRFS